MKKSGKQPKQPLKPSVEDKIPFVPIELRNMIDGDVKRFVDILGVNQYAVKVYYCDAPEGAPYETFQGAVIGATTAVDMRYLTADIKVFPFFVDQWKKKNMKDRDVHEMIAHEVAHIATENLRVMAITPFKTENDVRDAWESLTTVMGRLINKIDKPKEVLTDAK